MSKQHQLIADDTIKIIEQGFYLNNKGEKKDIRGHMDYAVPNTRLYTPADLDALLETAQQGTGNHTTFEVFNETTLDAARRLLKQGMEDIMCLNFASAKNPGGGFLRGSVAQEESIARASGLYHCLLQAKEYYSFHRQAGTCLYSDHMIYSPAVPVFKDEAGNLTDEVSAVNIITSAAVNAGEVKKNEPVRTHLIEPYMRTRIEKMLALCVHHQQQHLILGAWGCGVFRNDPVMIATLFKEALAGKFAGCFKQVTFAVKTKQESMIAPFQQLFLN